MRDDRGECGRQRDQIVAVAEHGNEIGDHIGRYDQIAEHGDAQSLHPNRRLRVAQQRVNLLSRVDQPIESGDVGELAFKGAFRIAPE